MKENQKSYLKYLVIGIGVFILFIISMQIISMFVPLSSWKLDFANYTNNLLSPIVSVLALAGVYATYSQQQKNHKDQLNQARKESSFNYVNTIYQEFYKNLLEDKGVLEKRKKYITKDIFEKYRNEKLHLDESGLIKSRFLSKYKLTIDQCVEDFSSHCSNFMFLTNQINGDVNLSTELKYLYFRKIRRNLKLLSCESILKDYKRYPDLYPGNMQELINNLVLYDNLFIKVKNKVDSSLEKNREQYKVYS